MSGLNRLNNRSMNAELMTQKADLLLQNQIIHEAGEKREISNSPRGQRNLKPEKSAKKRETVPLGNGAILFPERKPNASS